MCDAVNPNGGDGRGSRLRVMKKNFARVKVITAICDISRKEGRGFLA